MLETRLRGTGGNSGSSTTGSGGGSSTVSIPELYADPASPTSQQAWVLASVGSVTGGGKLRTFLGLGFPYTTSGATTYTYQLSYRTIEGTTIRTSLT